MAKETFLMTQEEILAALDDDNYILDRPELTHSVSDIKLGPKTELIIATVHFLDKEFKIVWCGKICSTINEADEISAEVDNTYFETWQGEDKIIFGYDQFKEVLTRINKLLKDEYTVF